MTQKGNRMLMHIFVACISRISSGWSTFLIVATFYELRMRYVRKMAKLGLILINEY